MAQAEFKDRNEKTWKLRLDAPLVEEVREKHGVDLVDLERDPLMKLRNDPMKLVATTYLICQEAIEQDGIDPAGFGKVLPHVDELLAAVTEAIIDFFPTGRASHVREVLTKYAEMNTKTDEIAVAKMEEILKDPETDVRIKNEADRRFKQLIDEKLPTN